MIGIAGEAVADNLGVNSGPAGLGMLQALQNHDARAFAHDETVAVPVVGPRSLLRPIVETGGKRPASDKPGQAKPANRAFSAASHHQVSIVERNEARGVADGVCAGRTRRDHGVIGAFEAVLIET